MHFTAADARRVLSFCLGRGYEVRLSSSDDRSRCSISVERPDSDGEGPWLFEGATFEAALYAAVQSGLVRKECIDRQISFSRSLWGQHFNARIGQWSEPQPPPGPPVVPMQARKLTLAHYRGLAEFRYQIRRFLSFSEGAAREAGVEPLQHQLLLAVRGLPPPRRADVPTLAERMCLDPQACQALADEVIARGLLRWTPNPADRRQRLLALTPAGHTLLRNLTALHRGQMLAVGPTFVQALGAILSSIEELDGQ
jgi:DNA-binding MarR family transcriptional regulator